MEAVSYFRGDIIIVFRQNLKRTELAPGGQDVVH
jgi:hypothetical protein